MVGPDDIKYLRKAIANSRKSFEEGRFPAGGVVVRDGEVLSSEVSSPYPGLLHADSKAVMTAFSKVGRLTGATLYIGLEPCLMCIGVAYWSGIRRIVFAVPKSKVSGDYYESPLPTRDLVDSFNDPTERIQVPELEEETLKVIREWEKKYLNEESS